MKIKIFTVTKDEYDLIQEFIDFYLEAGLHWLKNAPKPVPLQGNVYLNLINNEIYQMHQEKIDNLLLRHHYINIRSDKYMTNKNPLSIMEKIMEKIVIFYSKKKTNSLNNFINKKKEY